MHGLKPRNIPVTSPYVGDFPVTSRQHVSRGRFEEVGVMEFGLKQSSNKEVRKPPVLELCHRVRVSTASPPRFTSR